MIGTFAYLILASARNQLRARVARLRNPRYAIALLIGVTYLWFVYLRPSHDRPHTDELFGGGVAALLPLLLLAFVAWTWLSGGDRTALAFTQAEVTLLFTAPVSRRTLVLYRIARTQLKIVLTSLVWTLLFQPAGAGSGALLRAVSYWIVLSSVNLNRLGVALVRANGDVHGLRGARRNGLAIGVVVALVAMVAYPIATSWPLLKEASGPAAMTRVMTDALDRPPATWALFPFRLVLAPLSAAPGTAWLLAAAPALLLLAGMVLWVVGTDAAFEESAAEASVVQARRIEALRARRGTTATMVRNASRSIPLRPTGRPAVALLWKNAMWFVRSGTLRSMLLPPLGGVLSVVLLSSRSENAAFVVAGVCGVVAGMLLLVGPMSLRNDLRNELLHLSLLKTLPLRGRDVVLAEVASSALPLAGAQYLLLLVTLLSLAFTSVTALTPAIRIALIIGAVPLLVGLNGAVSMIHNGIALLFPGWVRLGVGDGGGIETLGLGMMNIALALAMLALMLLVPVTVLTIAVALLRARLAVGIVVGGLLAGALLITECMLCARALGGSLDRVEPLHVQG
ncbi:MAG: hypothetical protein JWN79_373 [Gemmatimonadetes bacterium]|nr:hypothetical protein [Gemmatimonadota bacterium]